MLAINVQDLKSRKENRQMKQIFETVNVLEIARLDAHSPYLSIQVKKKVASNEVTKNQTQNKKKRVVFFIKNLIKLWI